VCRVNGNLASCSDKIDELAIDNELNDMENASLNNDEEGPDATPGHDKTLDKTVDKSHISMMSRLE